MKIVRISLFLTSLILFEGFSSPSVSRSARLPGGFGQTGETSMAEVMTVSEVEARGGRSLSTEEIRELVLGKTLRITDLRTGERFDAFFGEDGTRTIISAVSFVALEKPAPDASSFEIRDGRLFTVLPDGRSFSSQVYQLGSRYLGCRSDEGGKVHYELVGVIEGRVTVASLETRGAVALNDEELSRLLVGKTLTIRHLVTGEIFQISYSRKGRRAVKSSTPDDKKVVSTYEIRDGRLNIQENESRFFARIYRLDKLYFGARSNEEGFVSYEILSSR